MDIQKEREEFENLPEIAKRLNVATYSEELGFYHAAALNSGHMVAYVQGAWMAWQAKSQAVQEKSCSIQSHEIIINETKKELINDYDIAKEDEYLLEVLVYRGVCIGKSQAAPEGFVLVEASEFESLKSDNEHFTKSCIDWTDRAYKQRAKADHIKNEVERFKQSGTNLDLSRFLDNLIEFSTFKHDKEFDGFVLVPRELSDEEARKHAESMFNKVEHMARYEQRDLSESEFESFKNRWIDARTLTIQFDWKAMIEAQEQSHDSQNP